MTKDPREIAHRYMRDGRVMQLATLHQDQPRANSLYYVVDKDSWTIYWLSESTRRHSVDIAAHARVGGAIVIKPDMPVAGLQFVGDASEVVDLSEQKTIIEKYCEKYNGIADGLHERIVAGTNKHRLYKVVIRELELFDENNFPGGKCVRIPLE